MKKIIFVRRPNVYLPEISAYIDYFNNVLDGWQAYDSIDIEEGYEVRDYDVVWRFMGLDLSGKGNAIVHEYNSLSTGSFAYLKNNVKRFCNAKPNARVFLNRAVRKHFSFDDDVAYAMRDMGIDRQFFVSGSKRKHEYDFVYAGSLTDRGDVVMQALQHFKTRLANARLLVIGEVPDLIQAEFGHLDNVIFTGRVPYSDVPKLASQSRYGLNLMPDIYPLNVQTATKVIEYCALGLKVVSTDYKWARRFERIRNARFFFLENDLSNFTMENIENFEFLTPPVRDLEWRSLIRSSGVFTLLDGL